MNSYDVADQGMELAARNAGRKYQDDMRDALLDMAQRHQEFFIDDFIREYPDLVNPGHPNAAGAPWKVAQRRGWIRPTGERRQSQITRKRRKYDVYVSLIYGDDL